jgi:hypothetical protein
VRTAVRAPLTAAPRPSVPICAADAEPHAYRLPSSASASVGYIPAVTASTLMPRNDSIGLGREQASR